MACLQVPGVTVVPASVRLDTGIQHEYEHFLAFGYVGFVFALAFSQRPSFLMLFAMIFTLMLEFVQIPLPTRHTWLEDFITNAFASNVGIGRHICPCGVEGLAS
jgi:VanZ family protein